MDRDDFLTVSELEKQRQQEQKRLEKQEKEKQFKEASKSSSFTVFNSVIAALSTLCTLVFCVIVLWTNSKIMLLVVIIMVGLSFLCRHLAKYYFFKGEQKKFEMFHKLSGVAGVASAVFELADMRSNKSRGAVDKIEDVEDAIKSTHKTISEYKFNDGAYSDPKYDVIRNRARGTGEYIYTRMDVSKIYDLCENIKVKRQSTGLSKDASVKLGILSMYIRDYLSQRMEEPSEDLFYCSIGALHYFTHPLTEIPDYVPFAGYSDNMFVTYCVFAGYKDLFSEYKDWRIKSTKTELETTVLKDSDAVWSNLQSKGLSILRSHKHVKVLTQCQTKLESNVSISQEYKEQLTLFASMFDDYIYGKYPHLSQQAVTGILGTLSYFAEEHDVLPDHMSMEGYIDDEIIVKCATSHCTEAITAYKQWKGLSVLYSENDPLVEYLNTVIGSTPQARDDEVKRLAKLCSDMTIKDERARARQALAEII